jgi:PTH2 family peptidyl-tRNA hydrolase
LKQVIVIRNDLNMRKGKMVAQGCHASLHSFYGSKVSMEWLKSGQKKIVVSVNSEEELHAVFKDAKAAGLSCHLVQDAGLTEFKEPTYTAVGIGPAEDSEIDKVTGHLKLL